jgi:archaellum component FlaG (FlaF/FlaG flagellin family)
MSPSLLIRHLALLLALCLCTIPSLAWSKSGAELRITTEPDGTALRVDGASIGFSPATAEGLSEGTHLIEAELDGYRTARTHIDVFEGDQARIELTLEPLLGLVLIHSVPTGAEVVIRGASLGKTPLMIPDLPLGAHRATLSKEGFLSKTVDIKVNNRIPKKVDIVLDSNSGVIQFTSKPSGATVQINGIQRGVTPCSVDGVPTGENRIKVVLQGHFPFEETVSLYPGQNVELNAPLRAQPGTLSVVSEPEGSKVYIDNQLMGRTPYSRERVKPGEYRVRVETEGYETESRTVNITATGSNALEFRLVKNSGSLLLVTEPAQVKVLINGRYKGATQPSESDVISEPLDIDLLPPGDHTLELVKRGYFDLKTRLKISAGEVNSMHLALKQRFIPDTKVRRGDRPEDVLTGVVKALHPNGDIELEVHPGVIVLIPADDIQQVKPITQGR